MKQQQTTTVVDLHHLSRDAGARETLVFMGTVTDVNKAIGSSGASFISFGAMKDGILHRTTVKARNAQSNKLWDKPLKRGSKVRVMVTKVMLHKDLKTVRISLRVAPQCTQCKHFGHMKVNCSGGLVVKQQQLNAKQPMAKVNHPDTRELKVAVKGSVPTPAPVPEVATKMPAFEPTRHFAACTLFAPGPKAKSEKAQAEAKAFWQRAPVAKPVAVLTTPAKQVASQATTPASKTVSKSAKRRRRAAAAKVHLRANASKQQISNPAKVASSESTLAATAAALSQLSEEQLVAVLSAVQSVATGA